ncbi:hypothetical protein Dsin_016476 [Dipteronia sinensis]|uniref:DUF4283 domain-containing protein n=1 Tax=Dipteronia sinensis TaxID=43782 RepID=A0AAE0AD62_9ROSI|nr:hypothetical protein Dsin_016476 [Dipteronia sinensis]
MSTVGLAELYENLSLAEQDGAILEILEEAQLEGVEDVDRCLVGRVLARKKVNREAFKSLIDQLWSPFGSVEIELIGDNTFMFYFVNKGERNRFWYGLWLKAPMPDKSKPKPYQMGSGNSSDRDRSLDRSSRTPGERSSQKIRSLVSQDGESVNVVRGAKKMMSVNLPETLKLVDGPGPPHSDKISIEGPDLGTIGSQLGETFAGPIAIFGEPNENRVVISKSVGQPVKPTLKTSE